MPPSRTPWRPEMFRKRYGNVLGGNDTWNAIGAGGGAASELYAWDTDSTYVREPPFFAALTRAVPAIAPIADARAPGRARRFDHHRSHLPGRRHLPRQPGRALPARAWRGAGRLQHLRRPAAATTR